MRRTPSAMLLTMVLAVLAACTNAEAEPPAPQPPDGQERRITVWSRADSTRSVATTKRIIAGFTAATGIKVDLVPVGPARLYELVERAGSTSTTASTSPSPTPSSTALPDVIGALSLASAHALAAGGLLDASAASHVVDELGRDTFRDRALQLTMRDGEQIAVPSHTWTQLLVYRKDIFAKADLPVPDTFTKIRKAAKKIDNGDRAGIALPTTTDGTATTRIFEHLALANRCRLVSDAGTALGSDNCVDTFDFYAELASHSPSGGQDAETAREAYLAGRAALILAPSGILDDLAGLDAASPPTCGPCKDDPAFLAKNSGIVTTIRGSHGVRPVQYGGISSWAITATADTEAATQFVRYVMDDGYLEWLGTAPGARFPVRTGTGEDPEKFAAAWSSLPAGAKNTASLADLYPLTVLDLLRTSPDNLHWWALRRGEGSPPEWSMDERQAALVAAVRGEHPIAEALNQLTRGKLDPAAAAKQANQQVEALRSDTEGPPSTPEGHQGSPGAAAPG